MSLISSLFLDFIMGLTFPVGGLGDIEIGKVLAPVSTSSHAYSITYEAVKAFSVDLLSIEKAHI